MAPTNAAGSPPAEAVGVPGESDDELGEASPALPNPAALPASQKPIRTSAWHPEVDCIKAICLCTVVLIHTLPNTFAGDEITLIDEWVGQVTHFAVPGFLACSGFLYANSASSKAYHSVRPRLERLLVPYVVFSCVAFAHNAFWWPNDAVPFVEKLVFFSTMGHYYYVLLICCYVIWTPFVARTSDRGFPLLFAAALVYQITDELHVFFVLPLFWHIRNPMRMFPAFLLGWLTARHWDAIVRELTGRRRTWVLGLGILNVVCAGLVAVLDLWSSLRLVVGLVNNYAVLALVLALVAGRSTAPTAVTWLAGASYPIYLAHFFFLQPLLRAVPCKSGVFDPSGIAARWAGTMAMAAAFVVFGRRVLGEQRARWYLGG